MPGVLKVVGLARGSQLAERRRDRIADCGSVPEEEIGQIGAARVGGRITRHLAVKFELGVEELAPIVVVAVPADLRAHPEGMLAASDGEILHPLECGVLVGIWVGASSPGGRGAEVSDRGHAPGYWHGRRNIRNPELPEDIAFQDRKSTRLNSSHSQTSY